MSDSTTAPAPVFPMPRSCPFGPPAQYADLRADRPISKVTLQNGSTAWLVTRHEYVRAILGGSATSSNRLKPGFPATVANIEAFAQKGFLLSMDAPEHSLHRKLVTNEFTVQRTRLMRPRIQEIVDDHIDRILATEIRPIDLVRELALPVPSLVVCELLGVPYDTRDVFQRNTEILLTRTSTAEQRAEAFGALRAFFGELVAEKERNPQDDLLGRLSRRYREAGIHDHDQLTGFAMLLLLAGHETTANMISLGVAALLSDPVRVGKLRADPAEVPRAVEELLRYFSIVDFPLSRVAIEDIEIGGVLIRKGEGIIASGAAANHDEAVFPDAGTLDLTRNARGHVAFGFGVHQCLGQNLARAELDIVYSTLFARIPTLRLVLPAAELAFKDASVYGIHRLDVTW